MAITTMDKLVAAIATSQQKRFYKQYITAKAAGAWVSFWADTGEPGAGSAPGATAGVVPTSATAGAIPFTDAGGSDTSYLARLQAMSTTNACILVLADRLYHSSGFSGTNTGVQSVTSPPALTRPDNTGANNELWIEWYAATGSGSYNLSVIYKDQLGNSQTTTFAFQVSPAVGQMQPVPLVAGSTGVRSITSVQLSGSTGTAGNFGLTILRRLGEIVCMLAATGDTLDAFALGLPTIDTSACLFVFGLASTTNIGDVKGGIAIAQG
jgi:hypothetical protein